MGLSTLDLTLIRVCLRVAGVPFVYGDTTDTLLARFADVYAEKPIQAIKEFRAVTGLGLKESKDIWDRLKPLAMAAKAKRDAIPAPGEPNLKAEALGDFRFVVDSLRDGQDDEWTQRAITRVTNFLQNC